MFDNDTWQIGGYIALVAGAALAAVAIHWLAYRLMPKLPKGVERYALRHARNPMRVLLPLIAVLVVLPLVDLSPSTAEFVRRVLGLAVIGCVGWLAIALLSV